MGRTFNEELKIRDFVIKATDDEMVSFMAKQRKTNPTFIRFMYECTDLTKREVAFILGLRPDYIERLVKKECWKKQVKVQKFSIEKIKDTILQGTFGIVPVKYETEEELRQRSAHIFRVLSLMIENNIKTENFDKATVTLIKSYQECYKELYDNQLEAYGYVKTRDKIEFDIKYKMLQTRIQELEKEKQTLKIENVQKFETSLGLTGGEVANMVLSVCSMFVDKETSNKIIEGFKNTYQKLMRVENIEEALPAIELDTEGRVRRRAR